MPDAESILAASVALIAGLLIGYLVGCNEGYSAGYSADMALKRGGVGVNIEIRPYRWNERGYDLFAKCFPFVDGQPRYDITCDNCEHYDASRGRCHVNAIEKYGAFCGPICGDFKMKEQGGEEDA